MTHNNYFIVNGVEVDDGTVTVDEFNKFLANIGSSLSISIPEPIHFFQISNPQFQNVCPYF